MPLDGAYCNAILLAHWSVCQKLNHVSLVRFSYVALCLWHHFSNQIIGGLSLHNVLLLQQ